MACTLLLSSARRAMTTAAPEPTNSVANGKGPAKPTKDQDLGAFYADRAHQHREYVAGCIQLADKVTRAFQPRLGADARLAVQSLKPSPDQRQITPNGVLQENGVAVFGYAVDFEAQQMPPHVMNFFLSVGKLTGEKGKVDDWYVGHDGQNFSLPGGGEGQELDALFASVVGALEAQIVSAYPTDAQQDNKAKEGAQAKDEKADGPKPDAPKPAEPKADATTAK
jgi:hypothetical protein